MIAKLYNEIGRKWILIGNVTFVESYTSKYKLRGNQSDPKATPNVLVEELPKENPPPDNWNPNCLYLARLLVRATAEKGEFATFKVIGLYVPTPRQSETEKYYLYGFKTGYLLNNEGKTIDHI